MISRQLAAVPSLSAMPTLAERLATAVRPEFRAECLTFPAADPVFGGPPCRVGGCPRPVRGQFGLCDGHRTRWTGEGRPDVDDFAATTDQLWRRQRPVLGCRVANCRYGVDKDHLCRMHIQRWRRAARPDLDTWLVDPPTVEQPPARVSCRVGHCDLWPEPDRAEPFCQAHAYTWKVRGRPDVDAFAAWFADVGIEPETVRLSQLSSQLRLEIQYALQCRGDDRTVKTPPTMVTKVVRFLAGTGVTSLLERSEQAWRDEADRTLPKETSWRALLIYAHRKIMDLAEGDGWESEYPRDVWQLRRLGIPGNRTFVFTAIPQPWLRELVKRWLRWRLSTGLGLTSVRGGLLSLTRFAGFLDSAGVTSLADVDRDVLERYLADLHAGWAGRSWHGEHIGQLNSFLRAVRQHGWDPTLPTTALLFSDDYPQRPERLPRALAEHVMVQVEHPDNLGRWTNPAYQLISLILMRCGLRIGDAVSLPSGCLVTDADGAPYLRYFNHKMKREALVPVDEELRALVTERQKSVGTAPVLFPRQTANPDRAIPMGSQTYRSALYRWLAACDVRDAHGQPVRLTPHQWRHTLGTRMINRDVPQEVVRRILDHDSHQMTSHYARLHDTTVRRHWEAARKVDNRGKQLVLDPDGPLAEAAWAKQRLGRATQALPNGYCGLPVVKTCPHANACLTCPMFVTTAEFLPQHHGHRAQLVQIITAAEARGQTRLAEMNQQVLGNLDQIITSLEQEPRTPEDVADAC